MRRIKRLLSLAIAGALFLGVALTEGFVGESAFGLQRAFAEASEDGSAGEEAPSEEKEPEEAEKQEKKEEKEEEKEEKEEKKEEKEEKEEKKEEPEQKKEETPEKAPEQKKEEEKAPEAAPEQKAEEKAPEKTPEQKEEEKAPEAAPEQKAEEQTPEAAPEQKKEEQTPEAAPEQKKEEQTPEVAPEQKAEEEQIPEAAPEQKAEEQTPEAAPEPREEEEKTSEDAPGQKEKAEKADSREAEDKEDEDVRLTLTIASPGGLSSSGGAWQVDPAQVGALTLAWSCEGKCDTYEVSVSGGVYSGTTRDTALKFSVGALSAGKYTATVKAIRGGKTVAKEKLSFQILASGKPADAAQAQRDAEETPAEEVVPNDPELVLDDDADPEPEEAPEPVDDGMILDVQIDLDTADEATDPETEDPEAVSLSLTIAAPQGLPVTDGVYQVDPSQVDALTIAWECSGDCDGYAVSVSGGVYGGETTDTTLTLPVGQLAAGKYTVKVEALRDGSAVARARLTFQIADTQQQPGGDQQPEGGAPEGGMPTGGMPSGGAPKGGGTQGALSEEEQGFHVTPGEALVSTHTSGSRDMRLYNTVALTLDIHAEMTELVLGGVPLDVMLDGGSVPFTGRIEGDTLTLTAAAGDTWTLNGRALKILFDSGIDRLMLQTEKTITMLETALTFQGSVYASLCREGFVSADYTCQVNAGGMTIEVAGEAYRVGDAGELIPMEGDGNAETMVHSASGAA